MNKSILVEQLTKFSPKEIKEFGDFVNSPFFNKNESVIRLFEYLRKLYPDFESEKLNKEYVYEKLFPKTEYNDGFMRTIMFNLSNLAEDFLAYRGFKSKQFAQKRYLLHELNERDLNRQIEKNMKEIVRQFEADQVLDSDHFYNKFILDYEYFYYLTRLHQDKTEKIVKIVDIENLFNHLTYFYLLHTLKFYIYYLNTKNIFQIEFKTELIEHIIDNLKPQFYTNNPSINIYYHVLQLHLNEDQTSNYFKVKELADKHEQQLTYDDMVEIYINLENYCKRMIRKGNSYFIAELFNIYETEIEKEFYWIQGKMSIKFYRSAVDTALKLKKFDWTKEFIEKHKKDLAEENRENSYFYSLALYEFAIKNYEKTLELLSRVKYSDIYHKTEMKCFLGAVYYELNHEDTLMAHLDTFRHFLSNDKLIPESRKAIYSNFLKYIKQLSNVRNKENTGDLHLLKRKVNEESKLHNKEWILTKIEQLENSK